MNLSQKTVSFAKSLITRNLDFEFEGMPFHLEGISLRKLMAAARAEVNCARRNPKPPWYPTQLQIEVSAACTLHCSLCPAGTGSLDTPRRVMTFDTFRSVIDEFGDYALIAILWMWGEPFMNPNLPGMISYARSKGVATLTSTNGQHIQTAEEAERLVSSGLDGLIVALDGATQESYSRYRIGGSMEKLINCLKLIRQAKDALGIEKPYVNVRTVVMKHNESDLPEIDRIAEQYGANMVSRKWVWIPDGPDADCDYAPENPKYKSYDYQNGHRVQLSLQELHCNHPFNRFHVTHDGTVISCEFDYDAKRPLGKGGSFREAWWGEEARKLRQQFVSNRDKTYPCNLNCGYRDRRHTQCTVETKSLR